MSGNANIGLSRKQRVFAVVESVVGTMVFPVATTDFIRPAGNAVINQSPVFVDSEELQDTLDVLDQFQNATPAGKWSLPMYLRPTGTVGVAQLPQGSVLLECLQGVKNPATTAAIVTNEATASTSVITIDTIAGGTLPERGVVSLAGTVTEQVHYTGITRRSRSATTATLTGCTRGYNSTTAATHAIAQVVTLVSSFYKQQTTSPSFSLWIETDHFVQGLSGCSVENATFEVSNSGAVKVTMDGEGMQMVWAGTSTLTESAAATNNHIHVADASLFSAGAYIYSSTAGTMVRKISAVDLTNNTLTLTTTVQGATWTTATTHVIKGYLPPTIDVIGDPIESKDTSLLVNGVAAKIKTGSLVFAVPKKYIDDEIGAAYPEDYLEDKREITSNFGLYFKKADAKYFADGFEGNEVPVLVTFGDTVGSIIDIYLKRCKLTVPTINFNAPAVELTMPIKALGTAGEDSAEIVIR